MGTLKKIYLLGLESIGDRPSWKRDWRWVVLYGVCIYAVVLAFRCSFASRWDVPSLWVNGERILSTHDSYYWLAKAKGVGMLQGYPLAEATRMLHDFFGLGYGSIGFWGPAVMASLVGVVCFLWGWLIAGRNAGILAGLIGSLSPGYYYRSRLGYFDTDMFTLFMPMFVAWMLAYWVSKVSFSGWFTAREGEEAREPSRAGFLWMAFAFGVTSRFAGIWHHDIVHFTVMFIFFAAVVILVNGLPGKKSLALYGLVIFFLSSIPGSFYMQFSLWPFNLLPVINVKFAHSVFSILLAAALVVLWGHVGNFKGSVWNNIWVSLGVLLAVILASNTGVEPVLNVLNKLSEYLPSAAEKAIATSAHDTTPLFPSIMQSIIEAKHIGFSVFVERTIFSSWLFFFALASVIGLTVFRPGAVFLIPLVCIQLFSPILGTRFTMFGGAAFIVFLGGGIYLITDTIFKKFNYRGHLNLGAQAVLGIAFLFYCHALYSELPLTPVITKQHAQALSELGEEMEPDSISWTWWDWGYATQYYTGKETVVDGGKHAGRDLYPVAFSMITNSLERSNRMISFCSQYPVDSIFDTGLMPYKTWENIPRSKVMDKIEEQLSRTYPRVAPQYFIVTWNDLTLAKWISYFGNWNLGTGTTSEAVASNFMPGELGFNVQKGAVMNRQGGGGLVRDITILGEDGAETKEYYMNRMSPMLLPRRQHLVINRLTRQSVLMDKIAFDSTMTKLLTGDRNDPEISKYFKLVIDKLPFARVYQVVQ